jgi:hypothetical protein
MTSLRSLLILCAGIAATSTFGAAQATVHLEPVNLQGPRHLEDQSQAAVVRDYLRAWQGLRAALEQNRPELLDADFIGTAKDKLAGTIKQQSDLGLRTQYQDRSHDLQILFYSPDGLSIELADKVEYDVQVIDHNKVVSTQRESARYLVVLTPAEVSWKVRVFQSVPE